MAAPTIQHPHRPDAIIREHFDDDGKAINDAVEAVIEDVEQDADAAFWAVVARRFPQVTTGDFDPVASINRRAANVADLTRWLSWNLRYTARPVLLIGPAGDDWTCAACGNDATKDGFVPVASDNGARVAGHAFLVEVEPTDAAWPIPLSRCERCLAVYLVPATATSCAIEGVRE